MRLLHIKHDGKLALKEFDTLHDEVPPYAVLSYISEGGDVFYNDLKELGSEQHSIYTIKGTAWEKIRFCAKQMERGGPNYFWIEACCVNYARISEVYEAFDKKGEWLMNAQICYALLLDVFAASLEGDEEPAFKNCTWFTNCWTFLDLFAPPVVEFFSRGGIRLGDKRSLLNVVREAARIPSTTLLPDDLSFPNTSVLSNITHVYDLCQYRLENCKRNSLYCRSGPFGCLKFKNFSKDQKHSSKQMRDVRDGKRRRENINRWLSALGPSVNSLKARKQRLAGTGSWFLNSEEYKGWRDRVGSSQLWIQGPPGSGKTALSSTVIKDLQQHGHDDAGMVTAYFYFGRVERQDAGPMLRALLYRFLENLATIPDDVEAFLANNQTELENPQQSTRALMELARHVTPYFTHIYIVLDSLDECAENPEVLVAALQEIMNWQSVKIHILITSRETQDLVGPLRQYLDFKEVVSINDLRLFYDGRLAKWKDDAASIQEIRTSLAYTTDSMTHKAESQLTRLSMCSTRTELRESLAALVQEADETYDRVLCSTNEEIAPYLQCILKWLACSVVPLTPRCIQEIIDLNPALYPGFNPTTFECNYILHMLQTLGISIGISMPNWEEIKDSTMHSFLFKDRSIRGYLFSDRIKQGPARRYSLQEAECHKKIAEDCLKCLMQLQRPLTDVHKSSLIFYAATSWALHFQKTGNKQEDLIPLVMSLFSRASPAFLNWIRLCDPDSFSSEPDLERGLESIATSLYYAAQLGLSPITTLLLDQGADVNAQGGRWGNPLQAAATKGHSHVVTILLDKGANVNARGGQCTGALQAAAAECHLHVVEILLNRGADVNMIGGAYGSALQAAAFRGHQHIVKTLIKRGADVNSTGGAHGSALQAAALRGHLHVVEILLDMGADVNTTGGAHGSALQAAAFWGHQHIVKTLLKRGAYVNVQGGQFGSAINAARRSGNDLIVDLILQSTKGTTGSNIAPSDSGYASQKQPDSLPCPSIQESAIQSEVPAGNQAIDQAPSFGDEEIYPDDIRSIQSDNESIGSKMSTTRSRAELFAVKHLAAFFAQLEDLRLLHETALQKMKRTRFIPNYRRILKSYYCRLLNEAASETEKAITRVLQSRRNRESIAEGIADQLELDEENEEPWMEKVLAQPTEKQYLEDWLRRMQGTHDEQPIGVNLAPILDGFRYEDNGNDSGSDTESEVDVQDEFANIDGAETFLQKGLAFRNLVLDIRLLMLPHHLRQIVETTPKISLQLIESNDITWINSGKAFLESYTGYRWDWWPLTPRIPNLGIGEHHLQWKLGKRMLFTKTTPDQAENLRGILGLAGDHPPRCHCCASKLRTYWPMALGYIFRTMSKGLRNSRQSAMSGSSSSKAAMAYTPTANNTSGTSSSMAASNVGGANVSGVIQNHSSNNGVGNTIQAPRRTPAIPPSVPLKAPTRVIFGVQGMRRSLEIEQIEICDQMNDQLFFRELNRRYKKHRWSLQRFLSPFRFQYCNFVKFEKLNVNRVFSFGEGLPDPSGFADEYDYNPKPPQGKLPLIEPGLFAVCLQSCEDDCKWSLLGPWLHDCFQLPPLCDKIICIPKKKSEFPVQCKKIIKDTAWGIEAEYTLSFWMLCVYHLIPLLSSFGFWIYWLMRSPGDWQNASVPTITTIALFAFVWIPFGFVFNSHRPVKYR